MGSAIERLKKRTASVNSTTTTTVGANTPSSGSALDRLKSRIGNPASVSAQMDSMIRQGQVSTQRVPVWGTTTPTTPTTPSVKPTTPSISLNTSRLKPSSNTTAKYTYDSVQDRISNYQTDFDNVVKHYGATQDKDGVWTFNTRQGLDAANALQKELEEALADYNGYYSSKDFLEQETQRAQANVDAAKQAETDAWDAYNRYNTSHNAWTVDHAKLDNLNAATIEAQKAREDAEDYLNKLMSSSYYQLYRNALNNMSKETSALYADAKKVYEDQLALERATAHGDDVTNEDRQAAIDRITQAYGADALSSVKNIRALAKQLNASIENYRKALLAQSEDYDLDRLVEYENKVASQKDAEGKAAELSKWIDEHGFWGKVGASVASVALSPGQSGEYLGKVVGSIGHNDPTNLDTYVPLDTSDMAFTNFVSGVRENVSEDMGAVGSFLYQTGMSIADSAFQVGTMGKAATVFMGMSAASNQMQSVIERGGTNKQAIYSGFVAGVAEALFEHISIDKLLSPKYVGNFKGWLKETFKQAGVEASEEVFTEIANIMADDAIMGDNSEFNNLVAYYQTPEGGRLSKEDARKKAYLERLGQVALAGLGGFISGGVMGGTVTGVNVIKAKSLGQNLQTAGALEQVQLAKSFADESDKTTMMRLNAIEAELEKGGTVDAGTLGAIAMENMAKVQEVVQQAKGYNTPELNAALTALYKQGQDHGYYNQEAVSKVILATSNAIKAGAATESKTAKTGTSVAKTTVQTAATALEATAATTQVVNPQAEVLDVGTTLYLQVGKDLKKAKAKSKTVQKLIDGQEVSQKELNSLDLTSKKGQQIFTQLTGVEFPADTRLSTEMIRNLAKSAHTVAQQKQEAQAVDTPAAPAPSAVNPDQDGFVHFVAEAEQHFPGATEEELAADYSQYMNGAKTVTFAGRSLNREQFIQLMQSVPGGQSLSQNELDAMFNRAVVDAMSGKDSLERFALAEAQKRAAETATAERMAAQDSWAKRWTNILKPLGITEVRWADDMAPNENAKYLKGSRVIVFNRNKIIDEHTLVWTLGHELVHSIKNDKQREDFVNDVIGTFEALGQLTDTQKVIDGLRITYTNHNRQEIEKEIAELKEAGQLKTEEEAEQYRKREVAKFDRECTDTYLREELAADLMRNAFRNYDTMVQLGMAKPSLLYKAKRILERWKRNSNITKAEQDAIDGLRKKLVDAIRVSGADEADVKTEEDLTELPPEKRHSLDTFAEALNLTFEKDGQRTVLRDANGNEISELTSDQIRKTPLGAVIHAGVEGKFITEAQEEQQLQFFSDFIKMMLTTQDIDLLWAVSGAIGFQPIESGPRDLSKSDQSGKKNRFAGYTNNSDAQYSKTVDFTTICLKTQAVIDAMSETMMKLGHGLTEQEIVDIVYRNVHEAGEPVPCPVCYVFSRWVGLGGLFDKMKSLQLQYENASEEELRSAIEDLRKQAKKIQERSDKKMRDSKALEQLAKEKNNRVNELNAKKNLGLLQNKETLTKAEQAELEQLTADLEILDNLAWLEQVRLAKNYEAVPDDVLFNINAGERFANDYPASWAFRTSRGPAMGKAATPYAPEHLGQILRGAGLGNLNAAAALGDPAKNEFIKAEDGKLSKTAQKQLTKSRQKVKAQNLLGGQRYQSTSDFRFEYALDYLLSFVELQTLGSKIQLYTKVPESVEMWASIGAETNCSLMPLGVGYRKNKNGTYTLTFSSVTGMNAADAFRLAEKYDNVQTIMVGTSDLHIELCLADDRIGFVIPYHASGATEGRYLALMEIVAEHTVDRDDYSAYQTDSVRADSTPEQNAARSAREKILTGKSGSLTETERFAVRNNKWLSELHKRFTGRTVDGKTEPIQEMYLPESERGKGSIYDPECYGVVLTANQAKQVMPYEFWDKTSTREAADVNGNAFVEYCESLGLYPRFAGYSSDGKYHAEKDFSQKPGYWKTLIDRCMYNNDGTYHEQRAIDVTDFNANYTLREPSIQGIEMPSILNDPTKTEVIAEKSARQVAEGRGERYSIAYEHADNPAQTGTLAVAKQRLAADPQSAEAIRRETGWWRGKVDGFWRFEIDDSKMRWKKDPSTLWGQTVRLGDVVKHTLLFRNYPSLADVNVAFDLPSNVGPNAQYNPTNNTIRLRENYTDTPKNRRTLIHEIQHAIQIYEFEANYNNGVATEDNIQTGLNNLAGYEAVFVAAYAKVKNDPAFQALKTYEDRVQYVDDKVIQAGQKLAPYADGRMAALVAADEVYNRALGEVEARDVSDRLEYSRKERSATAPITMDEENVIASKPLIKARDQYDSIHKKMGWNGVDAKEGLWYNHPKKRGASYAEESAIYSEDRSGMVGGVLEGTETLADSGPQRGLGGRPSGPMLVLRQSASGRPRHDSQEGPLVQKNPQNEISPKASDESGAFSLLETRYSISAEQDSEYMAAVQANDMETAQQMVREAAQAAGYTIEAYHGTNADFTVFDKNRIGKGIDKYGAGFYFANRADISEAYGTKNYSTFLKLENPIRIRSTQKGGEDLRNVKITKKQAAEILKRHPLMYTEESPLGDFYEEFWETGAKAWMINDLAGKYTELGYLEGDLFKDYPNEFHEAVRDVTGHDGVVVYLDYGNFHEEQSDYFYVAWFDNQMKSSEPVVRDDNGEVIPLSERFDESKNDIRYSIEDEYADTFYSHMANVIDEMKLARLGAANGINYLKGRGVKDEEIKWSGIEEFFADKKSVSKEELQEFVRNNQLVIEEEVLVDSDNLELTEEEQQRVDRCREAREKVIAEIDRLLEDGPLDLYAEWQATKEMAASETGPGYITRSDFRLFGEAVEKYFWQELRARQESAPTSGELRALVNRNDDFGFDNPVDPIRHILNNPAGFARNYDMSDEDKQYLMDYAEVKKRNDKVAQEWRRDPEAVKLNSIESWVDDALDAFDAEERIVETAKKNMHKTRWQQHSLDGGSNYREILFRMPGSDYSNSAMAAHWKEGAQGILAHARIQDFDTADGKMLFIEEIQSDWHNAGHREGYRKDGEKTARMLRSESENAYEEFYSTVEKMVEDNSNWEDDDAPYYAHPVVVAEMFEGNESHFERLKFTEEQKKTIRAMVAEEASRRAAMETAPKEEAALDAPFKNTYHEFVLKRLLREAAEQGYDSIGWTTGKMQEDRWSSEYAEGYRIEYDQDIPKFLNKYGKKWGAKVEDAWIGGRADKNKASLKVELGGNVFTGEETDAVFTLVYDGEDTPASYTEEELAGLGVDTSDEAAVLEYIWNDYSGDEAGYRVHSMPITEAMRESVLYEGQPRFSLTGEKANLSAEGKTNLQAAKKMKEDGKNDEEIFRETGWYMQSDGKWRTEILDEIMIPQNFSRTGLQSAKNAEADKYMTKAENGLKDGSISEDTYEMLVEFAEGVRNKDYDSGKLPVFLDAPRLYEAYPQLKNVNLFFKKLSGMQGYTDVGLNQIVLDPDGLHDAGQTVREGLAHEIQHIIQSIEGFARGSTPGDAGSYEAYRNAGGEIEARDVESRLRMTLEERRNNMPARFSLSDSEGVDEEAQEVVNSLKRRARFARYSYNGYASYTTERMERELQDSMAKGRPDYARSYIAWVKPIDFIYATTTSQNSRDYLKQEAGELDLERLRNESQPIYLHVDMETGEIVGHEGRHRMLALEEAGVKDVAVIIDAWNDDRHHTKPIKIMELKGQDFGEYQKGLGKGLGFYLHNALPMSERYADAVRELFSLEHSDVRFSLSDSEYMAAVENGDMETAQKMVDEAAKAAGYPVKLYHGTPQFGFTKADVSKSDDQISFFATDSLEVAETYSGKGKVKQVSDAAHDDIDSIEEAFRDKQTDLCEYINRVAGYQSYIEYNAFNEYWEKAAFGSESMDYLRDDFYESIETIIQELFPYSEYYEHMNDEGIDQDELYEQFAESDNVQRIYSAANDLEFIFRAARADNSGNYQFYANIDNLLELDAKGKSWATIPFDEYDTNGFHPYVNTRQAAAYAKANGFAGVKISNVFDDGGRSTKHQRTPATVYIFFKPQEQVKSADPITYDDNGNVIPLSERFNSENEDIRYSLKDSDGNELSEGQVEYFKNSKVRDENGNLKVMYHGTASDFTVFDIERAGQNWGGDSRLGKGFYFANTEREARQWTEGSRVIPAYLNLVNPLDVTAPPAGNIAIEVDRYIDNKLATFDEASAFITKEQYVENLQRIKEMYTKDVSLFISEFKYNENGKMTDGIREFLVSLGYDGIVSKDETVAFYPEQIKRTDNLNPTDDPDIRYSITPEFEEWYLSQFPADQQDHARANLDGARRWEQLQAQTKEGNFHPEGANGVREVHAPKEDFDGKPISKSVSTVMGAKAIPDDVVVQLQSMAANGDFSYGYKSDQNAIRKARLTINSIGFEGAMERFRTAVNAGRMSKDIAVLGQVLLNNAANSRDSKAIAELMCLYQTLSTNAGQTLQALSIFRKLDPESQLYGVQKVADKLNEEIQKKHSKKGFGKKKAKEVDPYNIPVEEWMQKTGEQLAKELVKRTKSSQPKAKTTAEIILGDLRRIAFKSVKAAPKTNTKRSDMEIIEDLFWNQAEFQKAWDAAKATVEKEYGDNPAVMEALEAWRESALDYQSMFSDKVAGEYGVKIDPALVDKFLSQTDQEGRDAVMDEIYQNIADQVPSTWMDKWNAWRYLAMLGNLRTHGRNLAGNALFQPVVLTKNVAATLMEAAVYHMGGKNRGMERSKAFTVDPVLYKMAWNDFGNVKDAMAGSKYNDTQGAIMDRRTIFKFKPLEALRKANSNALSAEDAIFKRVTYTYSLASYLKAHGVSGKTIDQIDPDLLSKARDYAGKEALKATYNDTNALSSAVGRLGGLSKSDKAVVRAAGVVVEGALPFKKTPANILVRGLEYSPVGLAKGLSYDLIKVAKGEKTAAEAMDAIASGLSGSALFVLGMVLAAMGRVSGGAGEDKDDEWAEQLGHQAYALELEDGTSVTLDWLAPEAIPFFMGVELLNAVGENGFQMDDIWTTAKQLVNPMMEMSMLQSLTDLLDTVSYSDSKLTDIVMSALISYVSQGVPTIGGQIERTGETERTSTYTDKTNTLIPSDVQYAIGKASAKIPGWDYQQVPYIDVWGQTENTGELGERAFNNFLSPAYTSQIEVDDVEHELQRLREILSDTGVYPSKAKRYIEVDNERIDLTAEQYITYATTLGQTRYSLLSDGMDTDVYGNMTDKEKADYVAKVYTFANAVAKMAVSDYTTDDKWVHNTMNAQKEIGVSPAEFLTLYVAKNNLEGYKDEKGNTVDNSQSLKVAVMVYDCGYSEETTAKLLEALGVSKTVRGWNPNLARRKLEQMEKKYG